MFPCLISAWSSICNSRLHFSEVLLKMELTRCRTFTFIGGGGILTVHLSYDDLRFTPDVDAQQEQSSPQTLLSSFVRAFRH